MTLRGGEFVLVVGSPGFKTPQTIMLLGPVTHNNRKKDQVTGALYSFFQNLLVRLKMSNYFYYVNLHLVVVSVTVDCNVKMISVGLISCAMS